MPIEIANESGVELDADAIRDAARHALTEMGVHPMADLSILAVDKGYMADLNRRWMGADGPTDVLAFPMDELNVRRGPSPDEETTAETLLGDIVLCPEVAANQALAAGHTAADELHMLTVHGVLHILGYDHAEPDEAKQMFGLQKNLLDSWRRERTLLLRCRQQLCSAWPPRWWSSPGWPRWLTRPCHGCPPPGRPSL